MTQVVTRALPFILTFILGLAVSSILGTVWPSHQTSFHDGRGCPYKRAVASTNQ